MTATDVERPPSGAWFMGRKQDRGIVAVVDIVVLPSSKRVM
jgi:hypothetical protein